MRGAPVIAAMRTAMERAEAAGRSKAESSERAASTNSDDELHTLVFFFFLIS
jgi:hypothetical protein